MIRVIQSNNGTYKFKNVMLDLDGTNLDDGVDVYLDGEHIGELQGYYDLEDYDGDKLIQLAEDLN